MKNNEFWSLFLEELFFLLLRDLKCHVHQPYFSDYCSKVIIFLKRLYKSKMSLSSKKKIRQYLLLIIQERKRSTASEQVKNGGGEAGVEHGRTETALEKFLNEITMKRQEIVRLNIDSIKKAD